MPGRDIRKVYGSGRIDPCAGLWGDADEAAPAPHELFVGVSVYTQGELTPVTSEGCTEDRDSRLSKGKLQGQGELREPCKSST